MSDREAAAAIREAAVAEATKRTTTRGDSDAYWRGYANCAEIIASAIRQLPLPEPTPDPRDEALAKAREALKRIRSAIVTGEEHDAVSLTLAALAALNPGDAKPDFLDIYKKAMRGWTDSAVAEQAARSSRAFAVQSGDAKPDPRKSEAEIRVEIERHRAHVERIGLMPVWEQASIAALEWMLGEPKQDKERAR